MKIIILFFCLLFASCANEVLNSNENKEIDKVEIKEVVIGDFKVNIKYNNTYYVSLNGDDTSEGSRDNPWRSINYAVNSVKPGDRVFILEGEYVEEIFPKVSGSENSYITIEGEGEVIIRSANTYEYSNCFVLVDVSYLYFKNLKLTGSKYANFEALDDTLSGKVNNIILDGIESYECFVGISFTGVKNSLIINSNVHDNQFNIELIDYNEEITISNNNIYNSSVRNPKLESYWSHSLQIYSDGKKGKINKNIKILKNNVYGGDKQGILVYRTENTLIDGNNCFNNGATGIQVESDDMQDSKNIIVQNNKCYNNSRKYESEGGIWIDDTVNSVVRNNEIYGNERGLIISGSKNVIAYGNYVHDNYHTTFINGGGLAINSSKGQAGQVGVSCSKVNVFNNKFINNGALSQRAQVVIGYFEYDNEFKVSDIEFTNNIVANTPNSNIYKLDFQAYGDNIKLDYNQYYNEDSDVYFWWQMNRDPWGDYTEEPQILTSIPDNDLHSSFKRNKPVLKTYLAEIVKVIDSKTVVVDDSLYFCDGFGMVPGDIVLIDTQKYQVSSVDHTTNRVTFNEDINLVPGDKLLLDGI